MKTKILLLRVLLITSMAVMIASCGGVKKLSGELNGKIEWEGVKVITSDLILAPGSQLIIRPGTVVMFASTVDETRGAIYPTTNKVDLIIKGQLLAVGKPIAPITFRSEQAEAGRGAWGSIILANNMSDNRIGFCRIEGATCGIRSVASRATIKYDTFFENQTGLEITESRMTIRHNAFRNNEHGFVYSDCDSEFSYNEITGNDVGIYFEKPTDINYDLEITHNNIYNNTRYNFLMGNDVQEEVIAMYNWWGSTVATEIEDTIFAANKNPELGSVTFSPFLMTADVNAGSKL